MSKLIFLDTETTTHLRDKLKMWQFAALKYNTETKEWSNINILMNPEADFAIDALVKCNPNLNDICKREPFKIHSALIAEFLELNNTEKVYYIAHNARFDRDVLVKEFTGLNNLTKLQDETNWIDTYAIAMRKYQDSRYSDVNGDNQQVKLNLSFLYYYCGLNVDKDIIFHNADSDIEVLKALFMHLKNGYSLDELVEQSINPIILNRFRFGKYEGKLIKDVVHNDFKYIQWMVQNLDSLNPESDSFDINLYYTIQQNIKDL